MPTKTVTNPILGLYLGVSPAKVPERALSDCLNVRIFQGRIVRDNMGWGAFPNSAAAANLDGKPVTLIDSFKLRNGTIKNLFANTTDIFVYDNALEIVLYLSPRYGTGTVDVTNGSPNIVGTGTTWTTNAKAGDFFALGADETDPSATWYEIDTVVDDTNITLTANYAEGTLVGQAYTIRQTFTGGANDVFFTEPFYGGVNYHAGTGDDRWYATNGVDAVIAWDGVDDQVYLPDLDNVETCKYLRVDNNRMVYVAPTTSGEYKKFSIRTSDVGDPEETVTGEAVELVVHGGNDELLAAEPIGDLLAIYARASITVTQYVGAPIYYAFRTVVTGAGPQSARAIGLFADYHLFIGNDCQYIFDGARAEETNKHLWRDVVRRIVPDRAVQIHCWFDENVGELQWVVPLTTDAEPEDGFQEKAFTHHYLEDIDTTRYPDPHTFRDLPATVFGPFLRPESLTFDELEDQWDEYNFRWNDKFFFQNFPQTLFGDSLGNIYILGQRGTQEGVEPVSYARFGRIALGDVQYKGVVKRIYPFMEQLPGSDQEVSVLLYTCNTLDGVATLASDQSFNLAMDQTRHFVSPRQSARYGEVQIGTLDTHTYWATSGYAVEHQRGSGK